MEVCKFARLYCPFLGFTMKCTRLGVCRDNYLMRSEQTRESTWTPRKSILFETCRPEIWLNAQNGPREISHGKMKSRRMRRWRSRKGSKIFMVEDHVDLQSAIYSRGATGLAYTSGVGGRRLLVSLEEFHAKTSRFKTSHFLFAF